MSQKTKSAIGIGKAVISGLGTSTMVIVQLAKWQANRSGAMALRIEKTFGVKKASHKRMQVSNAIAQTRKREKLINVRRVSRPVHA